MRNLAAIPEKASELRVLRQSRANWRAYAIQIKNQQVLASRQEYHQLRQEHEKATKTLSTLHERFVTASGALLGEATMDMLFAAVQAQIEEKFSNNRDNRRTKLLEALAAYLSIMPEEEKQQNWLARAFAPPERRTHPLPLGDLYNIANGYVGALQCTKAPNDCQRAHLLCLSQSLTELELAPIKSMVKTKAQKKKKMKFYGEYMFK